MTEDSVQTHRHHPKQFTSGIALGVARPVSWAKRVMTRIHHRRAEYFSCPRNPLCSAYCPSLPPDLCRPPKCLLYPQLCLFQNVIQLEAHSQQILRLIGSLDHYPGLLACSSTSFTVQRLGHAGHPPQSVGDYPAAQRKHIFSIAFWSESHLHIIHGDVLRQNHYLLLIKALRQSDDVLNYRLLSRKEANNFCSMEQVSQRLQFITL